MRIDRELDKVFRITLTEKEAVMICDASEVCYNRSKELTSSIGTSLLAYMQICSVSPDVCQPSMKLEL